MAVKTLNGVLYTTVKTVGGIASINCKSFGGEALSAPPVNTVAPAVTGTASAGSVLSCSTGTWTGLPTPTYTYQWQHGTTNIGGATAATYTLDRSYIGETIRCVVTGTNTVTAVAANSNASSAVVAVPLNTVAPAVTGTAAAGSTLSCSTGTWTGTATIAYTYQWQQGTTNIAGATSATYLLNRSYIGVAIRCVVTGTNTQGNAAGTSNATSAVVAVPLNTVAPSVTGTATNGQTLSCSTGTWTGTATITYAYQWKRAGSNVGSNSSTYALTASDVGSAMSCVVTGSNGQGSATGTSNSTGAVAAVAPSAPTSVSATATGLTTVTVSFGGPSDNGGSAVTGYTVSGGGSGGSGSGSPIYVTGLTPGASYTFYVTATNSVGTGPAGASAVTMPVFDTSRIIVPMSSGSNQMTLLSHNWSTNTTTNLGTTTQITMSCPSVVIDPANNVYLIGESATSNTGYTNILYLASGSTTPTAIRKYTGRFTSYGDYVGQATWDPTLGKVMWNVYPHYIDYSGTAAVLTMAPGDAPVVVGNSALWGWMAPDLELLRSFSASGAPTNGPYMIGAGANAREPYVACGFGSSVGSGSIFQWTGQIIDNASRCSIASTGTDSAKVIIFGRLYNSTGYTSYTPLTGYGVLNSVGEIANLGWRLCTSLGGGAVVAYQTDQGDGDGLFILGPGSSPAQSGNLYSSYFSGRYILYLIGVGNTLYVISRTISGTGPTYLTKLDVNTSGAYITGVTEHTIAASGNGASNQTSYRYY